MLLSPDPESVAVTFSTILVLVRYALELSVGVVNSIVGAVVSTVKLYSADELDTVPFQHVTVQLSLLSAKTTDLLVAVLLVAAILLVLSIPFIVRLERYEPNAPEQVQLKLTVD